MFLFGEEVGAAKDFLYGKVLENREDLQGLRKGDGKSLFRAYQDMIRLRLNSPGLRSRNIEILDVHDANRVLAFRRWDQNDQYLVIGSLNNQPYDDPGYVVSHPHLPNGHWREVFNSDAHHYGGWNQRNSGGTIASQAGSFESVIPRIAVTVFKKVD
jgi:1,4-alpha-glucan branching enzyme